MAEESGKNRGGCTKGVVAVLVCVCVCVWRMCVERSQGGGGRRKEGRLGQRGSGVVQCGRLCVEVGVVGVEATQRLRPLGRVPRLPCPARAHDGAAGRLLPHRPCDPL